MLDHLMNFPGGMFGELERFRREMDALFGAPALSRGIRAAGNGAFPPVNIGHTANSTEIYAFVPGLDPDKIDVTLERGTLTLSGERPSDIPTSPAESAPVNIYRQQRFSGKFRRAIAIPDDVDSHQVTATYRDGVLNISLKRQPAAAQKRIAVS